MRIAGLCLPLLLYADDIVLLACSRELMMRLLASLSVFCETAGLTVNLAKTEWLVGGLVGRSFDPGDLYYRGLCLHRVSSFWYLGLVTSGHSLGPMVFAR